MTIEAGKLRHRVKIQRQVVAQNSSGELTVTWATDATVWAAIEPLSAREFVQSATDQNKVVARVTIRYRPNIEPSMRLVHGQKLYNITGVLADKDSGLEYLVMPVSTGVNDGQ